MSRVMLRAKRLDGTLKEVSEMFQSERAALIDERCPIISLYISHPTESNTWILAQPANASRHLITSFFGKARKLPTTQKAWQVKWVSGPILTAFVIWAKQSCRAPTTAPFPISGLTPSQINDRISAAAVLGIHPNLTQFDVSYFNLPVADFMTLWRAAHDQKLTKITTELKNQFPSYIAGCTSLKQMLELYASAKGFEAAQVPLSRALWHKYKTTNLQIEDAIAFHSLAKGADFSEKAISWVIDRCWEEKKMTFLPADTPTDLAQRFQDRFDFRNTRSKGGRVASIKFAGPITADPESPKQKNKSGSQKKKERAQAQAAAGGTGGAVGHN